MMICTGSHTHNQLTTENITQIVQYMHITWDKPHIYCNQLTAVKELSVP